MPESMPEPQALFTPENSQLAAMLYGDPNPVHYVGNEFGVQIVPGMQQLQVALAKEQWVPGGVMAISFLRPIKLPNEAIYHLQTPRSFEFGDLKEKDTVFSRGTVSLEAKLPAETSSNGIYIRQYSLTDGVAEAIPGWEANGAIPKAAINKILPLTYAVKDVLKQALITAVGMSINAVVNALRANSNVLPDLYFPGVRDQGSRGVLEERLVLHMGKLSESLDAFTLAVSSPRQNPENKKGVIISVDETAFGIYRVDIYLALIPKLVMLKML